MRMITLAAASLRRRSHSKIGTLLSDLSLNNSLVVEIQSSICQGLAYNAGDPPCRYTPPVDIYSLVTTQAIADLDIGVIFPSHLTTLLCVEFLLESYAKGTNRPETYISLRPRVSVVEVNSPALVKSCRLILCVLVEIMLSSRA